MLEKSRANLEKVVLEAVSHLRVLHDSKQHLQDDIRDKVSWDRQVVACDLSNFNLVCFHIREVQRCGSASYS